jgi:SM-20-related protein
MRHLDLDRLKSAEVVPYPFEFAIIPRFLGAETIEGVNATFPDIKVGGSCPAESLAAGMVIKEVIEHDSREFEEIIENKSGLSLRGRPKMYSLRAHTRAKDGKIHTDSTDKIIIVLLYLNREWPHAVGRLRLLRDGRNLDEYVAEISPDNGTLLVFRRSDHSWHGHLPFVGPRRALQMNWMVNEGKRGVHAFRHKVSAAIKKLALESASATGAFNSFRPPESWRAARQNSCLLSVGRLGQTRWLPEVSLCRSFVVDVRVLSGKLVTHHAYLRAL